ncbi:MAG: cysteine desulfurase [Chloroflexi bacterium]|nr:cysteine desulfurase [Chloroflexota bacterium]
MSEHRIYLDHSATTPVDERVVEAMTPYYHQIYGNPSSTHSFGRDTEDAIETARETVAQILNCKPGEVIFTGCGTESDNIAIRGPVYAALQGGKHLHVISSPLEHPAVGQTVQQLNAVFNVKTTLLPVQADGSISPETLRQHLQPDTTVVSLMTANNEIGTVLPISELAAVAHENGTLFHTDAVQAAGQLPLDVQDLGVDMLSLSAHKFYGPKGVGVLYVREGTNLLPSHTGGSHEFGLRPGTHNVPLIVGFAKALELAEAEREQHVDHFTSLRDRLIDGILTAVSDVQLTGSHDHRLPSHASFVFKNADGNNLLMHLDRKGIAASSGSACHTGNPEPSDVILALGNDRDWALGSLRLTVGRHTTHEEIDFVVKTLPGVVEKVRQLNAAIQA